MPRAEEGVTQAARTRRPAASDEFGRRPADYHPGRVQKYAVGQIFVVRQEMDGEGKERGR